MTDTAPTTTMTLPEIVVVNIRAEIAYRGLDFKTVANRAGIPPTRLVSRNTGRTTYTLEDLEAIAPVIGVSVAALVTPRE